MHINIFLYIFCFSSVIFIVCNGVTYIRNKEHAFKIYQHSYYNSITGEPLNGTIEDIEKLSFITSKIIFKGLPCACLNFTCTCCVGLNISIIKFDQRYCMNSTFHLSKSTIDVKVIINENEMFNSNISLHNPPPICLPIPYIPVLEFCLRFHGLMVLDGNNIQACVDFETRIVHSPLLVLHFNCIYISAGGIAWLKPEYQLNQMSLGNFESSSTLSMTSTTTFPSITMQQLTNNVFDEVEFEISNEMENDWYALNVTTIIPEDEDKIGQHRWDIVRP